MASEEVVCLLLLSLPATKFVIVFIILDAMVSLSPVG